MKKFPVKNLRPGVSFTKPVFMDPDNMLAGANEVLTENDILRLRKWNIEDVLSLGEMSYNPDAVGAAVMHEAEKNDIDQIKKELKKALSNRPAFYSLVTSAENAVKTTYERLDKEQPVTISEIRTLAEKILQFVLDYPHCLIFTIPLLEAPTIYRHVVISSFYAGKLGYALDLSKPKLVDLLFSILLMDVGMMKIPSYIFSKAEQLSDAEKNVIHLHPVQGYQILTQTAKIKNTLASVALEHHEHFDGTGYPRKSKGAEMSEGAKIAAIVDSYTAIIETKPYRKSRLPYEAMKELLTLGIYRYDPVFMKSFLDMLAIYPVGSIVELSDGTHGMIVSPVKGKPMRPILVVLKNALGTRPLKPEFIHLLYKTDKYISRAKTPEETGISMTAEFDFLQEKI